MDLDSPAHGSLIFLQHSAGLSADVLLIWLCANGFYLHVCRVGKHAILINLCKTTQAGLVDVLQFFSTSKLTETDK